MEYRTGSWPPRDPASGAVVRERHEAAAHRRDYVGIPSLKGIYHGAPPSAQHVASKSPAWSDPGRLNTLK